MTTSIKSISVKCIKSVTITGIVGNHYTMRYHAGSVYLFKLTDSGYLCTSTENTRPILKRKFSTHFVELS